MNDEIGVRSEAKIDQVSHNFHVKFFIQIHHESSLQKVPKILRTPRHFDNYFPLFLFQEESK